MPSRKQAIFAVIALFLTLAIALATALFRGDGHMPFSTGEALVGGSFRLRDQDGKMVTDRNFLGKYMLVFFGYTYCPDVCPTELQVMTQAIEAMGSDGKSIQPVFITIDPERDTPEVLKAYVANFGPRLIGLTGSQDEVAAAAKAYRVFYKKVANADGNAYLMDHTSIIYLMDREGRFVRHFTYSTDAKTLSEALADAMDASS